MQIVSVFGRRRDRVLVEMSMDEARAVVPDGDVDAARPTRVVDAIERDLERIRTRDADLADSALAASAVAMAYEVDHPYNSATSKSDCQARLADALDTLRELMPPERKRDGLDEVRERREQRLSEFAAAADQVRS